MNKVVYFGGGVVIGAATGYALASHFMKREFLKETQKQVDEVVKYYEEKYTAVSKQIAQTEEPKVEQPEEVPEVEYRVDSNFDVDLKVIGPDELDPDSGYSTETFVLYGDGVITDDSDIPLSEAKIDELFTPDIYDQICRCEDSSMYIRNPMERVIYEIVMCPTEFNG